jgi:hypothetical protein
MHVFKGVYFDYLLSACVLASDDARSLGSVLGEGGSLGVAEWDVKECEPALRRYARAEAHGED